LDATVRRLLDFYLHTAFESNRLIDPHRDPISISPASPGVTPAGAADGEAAMAWFAAEGTVLLSAVQFAAEKGFDTHCWQVAWTLRDYLERGGWHGQAAAWRTAREAAQRLGDMSAQACLNRHLAEAYSHLGRAEDARSLLDEALHLCKRQNDRVGAAHTHFTHARVWMREGRLAEAIECDQHALDLYRAAGHLSGQANALNSIGWHYSLAGNHRKALLYCERAMSLMRILNDRHGQAATLDSLGLARYHLGQHAEAISNFQDALDLYRDLGNRYDEGETFINLGNTRFATGDVESARFAWRQALDILTEIEHPRAGHVRTKLQDTH
jgi:tetratricopeptide (TPR) repeat protein